jgi:hypothetical protein
MAWANWEDARRFALALPERDEHVGYGDTVAWRVKQKRFVWERPLLPTPRHWAKLRQTGRTESLAKAFLGDKA